MTIKDKVALVTGANRGIGHEVCRQLAKAGHHVVLTARDREKGLAATQSLTSDGLRVSFQNLDVTVQEDVDSVYAFIVETFGRLDVLVNNAGILLDPPRHPPGAPGTSAFDANLEVIRGSFEANTLGAFRLCQKFIPLMMKQRYGRVVNVSSGMGQLDDMNGGWPGYRISKTALNAVTRIFADEALGCNVLVNSVCPGWVKTDMGGHEADLTPKEAADSLLWLSTLPDNGPSGGFFRDKARIAW